MRKIIHCDCDCFFAAVEIRDNPRLRNLPVAVGGDVQQRGVIATCNYEARRYGVHSAMSTAQAQRACPQLVLLPGNMEKYKQVSQQVRQILNHYSEHIEPLSIDEAYLDVSQSQLYQGSATRIAAAIRQQISRELGITISAGVAPNKFLAKIASDWNKPDGLYVITPSQIDAFIRPLPVKKIYGVGEVTASKLHKLGIHTCGQLQQVPLNQLIQWFGRFGGSLYYLSRGIDKRPVEQSYDRKSLSVEHTFSQDLPSLDAITAELPSLIQRFEKRWQQLKQPTPIKQVYIKLKFNDFTQLTHGQKAKQIELAQIRQLCQESYQPHAGKPVRLIGIGVVLAPQRQRQQLELPLQL